MPIVRSGVSILGLAAVLPSGKLDNQQIAARFGEKEVASAIKMSGIRERRIASAGQFASDLALTAGDRVIRASGIDRTVIDLLIFVSQTPDYRIPTTASVLHGKLHLREGCATFDINQACSAYPYALSVAHSMIHSGLARYALVLNADTLTKLIHPQDRSLMLLHGDGAAATILGHCGFGFGFEGFALGTDGTGAKHLLVPAGGFRRPCSVETSVAAADADGSVRSAENLVMNGPAVFHFSVYKVPEVVRAALSEFSLTIDDVDTVILHQANKTMMDLIYKSLRVPPEKRFYCIETMGNSSGPSTAVALAEAWRQQKIRPGSRTLLCSFGAGLTWGVAVVRWPKDANPVPGMDPVVADEEVLSAAL
jgi:3-oxoacyl-[acyl-carrier-protein] synthase III